ncbi:hypothetical protein [Plastoroseomonas arctica]|uniref:Uncharacterized protein n=1 Tax=Plastoroseomonas arctica TaxID=1509237 RepID=A0AAF1JX28_9PROT|nr:hypothetical protein [Plastoroseomonas arctica]MBR0655774.1 hypothetical protein [Plastoroseomonas arctica]
MAKLHKWLPDDSGAVMLTTELRKIQIVRRDSGERVLICMEGGRAAFQAVLLPRAAASLARLLTACWLCHFPFCSASHR